MFTAPAAWNKRNTTLVCLWCGSERAVTMRTWVDQRTCSSRCGARLRLGFEPLALWSVNKRGRHGGERKLNTRIVSVQIDPATVPCDDAGVIGHDAVMLEKVSQPAIEVVGVDASHGIHVEGGGAVTGGVSPVGRIAFADE